MTMRDDCPLHKTYPVLPRSEGVSWEPSPDRATEILLRVISMYTEKNSTSISPLHPSFLRTILCCQESRKSLPLARRAGAVSRTAPLHLCTGGLNPSFCCLLTISDLQPGGGGGSCLLPLRRYNDTPTLRATMRHRFGLGALFFVGNTVSRRNRLQAFVVWTGEPRRVLTFVRRRGYHDTRLRACFHRFHAAVLESFLEVNPCVSQAFACDCVRTTQYLGDVE